MLYVAFTLGLLGSMHCVGMCGPLAITFSGGDRSTSRWYTFQRALFYNLGRTVTYTLLGLLFGIIGTFFVVTSLQKGVSICLGILLIITFFLSIDIDRSLNSLPSFQSMYRTIRQHISKLYAKSKSYPSIVLGMANGLLPCGLVYLAIAGAMASGSLLTSVVFMACFGLGTIPMLLALTLGYSVINPRLRQSFRRILPYVTLAFGVFLVYRGIAVDMPIELNFWEALKNPVLCH